MFGNPFSDILLDSTRQTVFLPVVGLVDPKELRPSDLVGVNKVVAEVFVIAL